MKTIEINLYSFDELSQDAQEKVIDKNYDINIDHEWWDSTYEDAKSIGKIMGIEISNIYFSGFSSQGDGACFEGFYQYRKNSVKDLKAYAPQDKELHRIVTELQDVQKRAFFSITANVKQRGHYSHSGCTEITVGMNENIGQDTFSEIEETVITLLRDFMDWIYKTLEKDHDYLTSGEAILETIKANEYAFEADGTMNNG